MESRKMVLIKLFAGQQWIHRHKEQIYGHRQGPEWKERQGQMENSMEVYTLPYAKCITNGNLLCDSGNPD